MDTIRRFRLRRKSKGQADSFVSFAEAESGLRSPTGTWNSSTGRPSVTIPRSSDADKKISHEHFRQKTPSSPPRASESNTRIQPMLVGVSRSQWSATTSRPGTAESFQDAVNRAADAVTNSDSTRAALSPSKQSTYKNSKYIDIFAIAGQTHNIDGAFNEDVASRNLDTLAVALDDAQYQYEPTSKYQEEVANRNAYPFASSRASSIRDVERTSSITSNTAPPSKEQLSKRIHNQDTTAYHSRQHNSRLRETTDPLPAIPQEGSDENIHTLLDTPRKDRIPGSMAGKQSSRSRWYEQQGLEGHVTNLDHDSAYSSSGRRQDRLRVSDVPSQTSSANRRSDMSMSHNSERSVPGSSRSNRQSIDPRSDRSSAYQISANEARARTRPMGVAPKGFVPFSDNRQSDSVRSPSTMSTASSVKRSLNLSNRRVMDLTGDDAEVFSIASYINTPLIQDATADTFMRVKPAVIENYSANRIYISNDLGLPGARWSSALEPVLDLDQLARRSQMIADTARAAAISNAVQPPLPGDTATTPTTPRGLAFSPIQTLTSTTPPRNFMFSPISVLSTSPRSSTGSMPEQESASSAPTPVPFIESARQLIYQDPVPTATQPVLQRSNSNRISAKIAPLVKVFAEVPPEDVGIESIQRGRKGLDKSETPKADPAQIPVKVVAPASTIIPEGFAGVMTRDFAILPIDKPTVKRVEALSERKRMPRTTSKDEGIPTSVLKSSSSSGERKSRSHSTKSSNKVAFDEKPSSSVSNGKKPERRTEKKSTKKSGKQTSGSTKKPRPVSIFDEEAFQKKQSEATAALLRLQESLQENLDEDESGQVTPRNVDTPVGRALSPLVNLGSIRTPDSPRPPVYYASPSQAAMAMIAAATSSPRNRIRPEAGGMTQAVYNQTSPEMSRAATGLRSPTEDLLTPVRSLNASRNGMMALNPMLAHIENSSKPPPSPGEVSLSAFPLPSSRAISPEAKQNPPTYVRDVAPTPVRRGSQASRMSSASAFSIPFTMVPGRGSSLPVNRMGAPGPSANTAMDSIDSIIPPTRTNEINVS